MDLNKFDEPFSPEDIEWRIQQSGKTRDGKVWAMVLAYVTNRAIMKRLDDVCGKAGWRNEYRDIPNNGGVECGISIKIDSEWVTKWDAAENTQVEAVKGGRSGICITLRKVSHKHLSIKSRGGTGQNSRMEQDFTGSLHRCRDGQSQHQITNHHQKVPTRNLHRLTARKS